MRWLLGGVGGLGTRGPGAAASGTGGAVAGPRIRSRPARPGRYVPAAPLGLADAATQLGIRAVQLAQAIREGTTNYLPGLLEARRLLRPDVRATGYATWQDHDALRAWHTGDVFGDHACPVLYAHGVFERSDTIVLGAAEYRDAYRPGPFRELVRGLWSREHLVFVGFGFTDAWFDTVAAEVLDLTREGAGNPRHIAIVGLADGEPYSPELRTMFRDAYDTDVLLYPVVGGDPGALTSVLAELAGAATAPMSAPAPELSATAVRRGAAAGPSRMAIVNPGVSRLTVFLCHSSSDKPTVRSLYTRMRDDGFLPWLDEMSILPGEDWDRAIRRAIRACQVVLICLSRSSVAKAGYLQKEIRFVLDAADEQPEGTIFLIPARLEDVDVPDRLRRWQWVSLFEEQGYERLVLALRRRESEWNRREQ
jgi:hypothetical protein